MGKMENEKSAESSRSYAKTKFQQLGYVFGSQLTDFDTNVLPKECDVISVWISKFDQARGEKRILGKCFKKEVIDDIVKSLIYIWQSQDLSILRTDRIKGKLVRLIRRAEEYSKFKRRSGDEVWVKEQYELFDNVFNIGLYLNKNQNKKKTKRKG